MWTAISIYFIVGLPLCKNKFAIMVVVDRFSKYNHFTPYYHPYSIAPVAQVFIDIVFKLHGMPSLIVSNKDLIFVSAFCKINFTLQDSKLCMSSSYHPQSDGQTEVIKRCLQTYWRSFVGG